VTIRNCDVLGFESGIVLGDSSFNTIEGNHVHDNVAGDWPVGIGTWGCSDNLIVGNTASNNGADGIHVMGGDERSARNTIIGNTANGNGRFGIGLGWTDDGVVKDNFSAENTEGGISVYDSDRNLVQDNDGMDNGGFGIGVYISESNTLESNTVTGNSAGISLGDSHNNTIRNNTASSNTENGLSLWESAGNTVSLNVLSSNDIDGLYINGDNSDGNHVIENTAEYNLGAGFSVDFGDGTVLEANQANENGIFGVILGQTEDSVVLRNNAVGNGSIDYIIVESRDLEIVENTAESIGAGFLISESVDVVIHENTASGGWAGFKLTAVLDSEVTHNHSTDTGVGYRLEASDGNLLKNNMASGFEYRDSIGFQLLDSHRNTLNDNTSWHPGNHGYSLWYSDGNKLKGNVAYSGAYSLGFVLVDSDGNSFKDNDAQGQADTCPPDPVEDCGGSGFHILGSSDNQFVGNNVDNYFIGFGASDGPWVDVFHGSHRNTYKDNVASKGRLGFYLTGTEDEPTRDNVLKGNVATGFHHGFRLENAVGNTLTDNTATYNFGNGFILSSSTENMLRDNLARFNRYGFGLGSGSTDNWLIGNTSRRNDRFGFSAFNFSPGNLLQENKACRNGEYDIWSHATSAFELVDNKVCGDTFVAHALILPTWSTEEDVHEAGQVLAGSLSEATGETFFVVAAENPRQMYDLMCAMPETAVGVGVNTLLYSFASEDCEVDASFKAIRYGYDTYWTEFLVPRDGGITQLSDLNGKSWVYPSPTLTSYYYVALAVMAEAGVTPGDAFDAGRSTAAVRAVYYRDADFGTVFYSPYVDVDGVIQWDFDPANADLPDISDCHFVTEAVGAFAEGDLVCGPTGGVWPDEYLEVRDARRTAEAPDIVDEVRILTLSPGVPNDAVAFGAEFDTDLRASVEDALRLFADEASTHFEEVWLPSLDLLYRWDGINDADDSDWDWIRPRLHGLFSIDDL
jgi:parallel beta-helix repeat protein